MSGATILLFGPSGVGKTTWLASLFREAGGHGLEVLDPETGRFLAEEADRLARGRPLAATLRTRKVEVAWRPEGSANRARLSILDYPGSDLAPGTASEVREGMAGAAGVLVLLPPLASSVRAADLYREGPPRWTRVHEIVGLLERLAVAGGGKVDVPVAVALSIADQAGEPSAFQAYLETEHATLVSLLRRYAPACRFFAFSAYGGTPSGRPQEPDPAARPAGVVEPLAWLAREAQEAAWRRLARLDPEAELSRREAERFLQAFPDSPRASEARAHWRRSRGRRTASLGLAFVGILGIGLVVATAFGARAWDPELPGSEPGRAPNLPADPMPSYEKRLRELAASQPESVERCDLVLERLTFLQRVVEIEPGEAAAAEFLAEVAEVRARVATLRERLRADSLARASDDWPKLLQAIEKFLEQGRKGEARTKVEEFKSRHWRPWAEMTLGPSPSHGVAAERVKKFLEALEDLPRTAEILAPLRRAGESFLSLRWQWSCFEEGGWFHGVEVERVRIHADCKPMTQGDGGAELELRAGDRVLLGPAEFSPRGPDETGWYEYYLGDLGPIESIEVPLREETVLVLAERDRWPNADNRARQWFKGPLDLFGPIGADRKVVAMKCEDETYDHVRVELLFLDARLYHLEADPQ